MEELDLEFEGFAHGMLHPGLHHITQEQLMQQAEFELELEFEREGMAIECYGFEEEEEFGRLLPWRTRPNAGGYHMTPRLPGMFPIHEDFMEDILNPGFHSISSNSYYRVGTVST